MWEAKLADYHALKYSPNNVQFVCWTLRQRLSIRGDRIKSTEWKSRIWLIYLSCLFLFECVLVVSPFSLRNIKIWRSVSIHFICHETLCNVSHLHRLRYTVICVYAFFSLLVNDEKRYVCVCSINTRNKCAAMTPPLKTLNVRNDGSVDRHQWVVIYGSTCMRERHTVSSLRCIWNCHSHSF